MAESPTRWKIGKTYFEISEMREWRSVGSIVRKLKFYTG